VSLRYPISGALIAAAFFLLGVLTTGRPVYAVVIVAVALGAAVTVGLWAVERTGQAQISWRWFLWGALLAVSIAAAMWAEETATEGCSGTLNGTRRVLATLALVAVGTVALWLPASGIRRMPTPGGLWRAAGFLVLGALWLLVFTFLWFVVWRMMFGCAD